MTTPMSSDELRRGLKLHKKPLTGVTEHEFQWDIGQVTLLKREGLFRVGYWEHLKPGARFYAMQFDFGPEHRGVAAVFQTSDPRAADPDHREYVVGWVPLGMERQVGEWIAFLNGEIGKHLSSPHAEATRQKVSKTETASPTSGQTEPTKTRPIRVGVFKELGYADDPAAPSLASVRGKRRADHKPEVIAYLLGGRITAFCMGVESDVFDETKSAGSLHGHTDGAYAWPELLAYYVEHYDIALPEEFEEHMRNNGWQVPRP